MFPRSHLDQRGITLVEIILWCAIVAAAAVAAFMFSQKASVTAAVESEQRQIEDIVKTVDSLFATQSDFSALGNNGAAYLKNHAARANLRLATGTNGQPSLVTQLGRGRANVTLSVQSIAAGPGPTQPNNGYRLAYTQLLPDECVKLVTASYTVAHSVSVDSTENHTAGTLISERGRMKVDADKVAQSCAATARPSVFLYFLPARAISSSPTPTTPPATRCNPVHEVQQTACPAGQLGSITQERDGTCTGPGNSMVYTAWTTTDNTCQAPPVAPPTLTPPENPDNCTTITTDRIQACAAGQVGQIVQRRTENTCNGTTTPWTTLTSSCSPPPTTGTCRPSTENRTQACPAGQGGQITQARSSTCASPTSTPVWGAWNTISNTCTTSCSQGGNSCCTVRRQTQPGPDCPAGTYGPKGEQERFLGCVNAQTQASSWTAWRDMTSGACTACPATTNETQTQWVNRTNPCPAGETGEIKFQAEQVRLQQVSYNCPAGTSALPAPTYGGWGSWTDTGAVRNVVNSCQPTGVEMCSDGSPLVSAWFSLDLSDPRIDRAYRMWNAPTINWVTSTVVSPTDAEAQRILAAVHGTEITRNEYPAPYPGNWPSNWNESASYRESCGAPHNAGNISAAYDQSFECVDNYGVHYCDYSFYSGATSFSVCRHSCLSDLVGKNNYPFGWTRDLTPISQSSNVCTGQPGCVANTYSITPPLCGPENIGQVIENVRWYHSYGTGGGAAWRLVKLTCGGPDLDPGTASCTVPAGKTFQWQVEDPARSSNYSEMVTCQGVNASTQTIAHGESVMVTDTSGAETGMASFRCLNGKLSNIQDGDAICAVTNPKPCVTAPGGRLFSWSTNGRFCQALSGGNLSIPSGGTITVVDNNNPGTNIRLSPRQGQATFACYNGYFTGQATNASCN